MYVNRGTGMKSRRNLCRPRRVGKCSIHMDIIYRRQHFFGSRCILVRATVGGIVAVVHVVHVVKVGWVRIGMYVLGRRPLPEQHQYILPSQAVDASTGRHMCRGRERMTQHCCHKICQGRIRARYHHHDVHCTPRASDIL